MIKRFFAVACLVLVVPALFAQPAPRPLPAELVERLRLQYGFSAEEGESLRTTGAITRFQGRNFSSLLLPDRPLAARLAEELKALPAAILVEALFVIPVEKGLPEDEDFRLGVYNTLRKIDKMKGLEYWSESNQRMRVMFKDAYLIASPDARAPLPNPIVQEIPDVDIRYVFQDDSLFGPNTYRAEYRHNSGMFRVTMYNLDRLFYGIIPVVPKEKLRLDIAILPGEDYLVFYSCIGADVFTFMGFERRVLPSFSNRIKALFSWFLNNM